MLAVFSHCNTGRRISQSLSTGRLAEDDFGRKQEMLFATTKALGNFVPAAGDFI
jgi:hypothetical protein